MNRRSREHPIDQPEHPRIRRGLRIAGPLLLVIGGILTLVGLGSFFNSFISFGSGDFGPPRYFWCAFIGLPMIWLGMVLSMAGFLGAAQRYLAGEVAPVQKDTFNYLARETKGGVRTIVEAIGEGFSAGSSSGACCPRCGEGLPAEARFCPGCGATMAAEACGRCGVPLVPGAKFCHGCGAASRTSEIA